MTTLATGTILGVALLVIGLVDLVLGVVVLPRKVSNPATASLLTLVMGISGFSFIVAALLIFAGIIRLP